MSRKLWPIILNRRTFLADFSSLVLDCEWGDWRMGFSRFLMGGFATALLMIGGLFLWQGHTQASNAPTIPKPPPALPLIPEAGENAPVRGDAPPELPAAKAESKERQRFNRYDRDRNDRVSRIEMMATRSAAFRKLDKNGDNLLSFEEWAHATGDKFAKADADGNGELNRAEFATTAPKAATKPRCKC